MSVTGPPLSAESTGGPPSTPSSPSTLLVLGGSAGFLARLTVSPSLGRCARGFFRFTPGFSTCAWHMQRWGWDIRCLCCGDLGRRSHGRPSTSRTCKWPMGPTFAGQVRMMFQRPWSPPLALLAFHGCRLWPPVSLICRGRRRSLAHPRTPLKRASWVPATLVFFCRRNLLAPSQRLPGVANLPRSVSASQGSPS